MKAAVFIKKNILRAIFSLGVTAWFILLAIVSALPIIAYRYYAIPEDGFTTSIDLVPKVVNSAGTNTRKLSFVGLTELCDLTEMSKHDYKIDIELRMPRNDINRNFGPFPVRAALGAHSWTTFMDSDDVSSKVLNRYDTAKVERMVSIPYKSDFIEWVDKFTYLPLYLFEFKHEESVLRTTLWERAKNPKIKKPHLLVVIPQGVWITESRVMFTVKLTGLRWLLRDYPISSFIGLWLIVFCYNIVVSLVIATVIYLKFFASSDDTQQRIEQNSVRNWDVNRDVDRIGNPVGNPVRNRDASRMEYRNQFKSTGLAGLSTPRDDHSHDDDISDHYHYPHDDVASDVAHDDHERITVPTDLSDSDQESLEYSDTREEELRESTTVMDLNTPNTTLRFTRYKDIESDSDNDDEYLGLLTPRSP